MLVLCGGAGTKTGAANIYGVPSQIRIYDAKPVCFIGARERLVAADLIDCTPLVEGWQATRDAAAGIESGCQMIRCMPAPQVERAHHRLDGESTPPP